MTLIHIYFQLLNILKEVGQLLMFVYSSNFIELKLKYRFLSNCDNSFCTGFLSPVGFINRSQEIFKMKLQKYRKGGLVCCMAYNKIVKLGCNLLFPHSNIKLFFFVCLDLCVRVCV